MIRQLGNTTFHKGAITRVQSACDKVLASIGYRTVANIFVRTAYQTSCGGSPEQRSCSAKLTVFCLRYSICCLLDPSGERKTPRVLDASLGPSRWMVFLLRSASHTEISPGVLSTDCNLHFPLTNSCSIFHQKLFSGTIAPPVAVISDCQSSIQACARAFNSSPFHPVTIRSVSSTKAKAVMLVTAWDRALSNEAPYPFRLMICNSGELRTAHPAGAQPLPWPRP
mmetsp:Transcript_17001/g.47723  ORF Transcript_17001/g.47723 Transcript_17001/m.47723 type:complete len:225 (+) Transcript_17001:457-1131(+)